MYENAQKFDWKTQRKIACDYRWLLHGKICPSRSRFFELEASPVDKQLKEGEKGKAQKKFKKNEKPEDVGYFLIQNLEILISAHARAKMSAHYHLANTFFE